MDLFKISRTENFSQWFRFAKTAVLFWLLILVSQFMFRLAFFFIFKGSNLESDFYSYVFDAFFMGARFDFGLANYLLAPLLLFSYVLLFLSSTKAWSFFHKLTRGYLFVSLVLSSFLALCNLTFYHYFQDHFNLLVFGLWEDDTVALVKSLWENEPILSQFIFLFVIFYLLWKLVEVISKEIKLSLDLNIFKASFLILISFLIVGFGARGTLNLKMHPLHRMHTEVSPYHFLNQVSFNPVYALGDAMILGAQVRASSFNLIEAMGYKDNIKQAYADLLMKNVEELPEKPEDLLMFKTPKRQKKQPHVVVVAMESMGSFWLEFDSDTYPILGDFKKHMKEDVFNTRFLPSGSGTYPSVTHWLLNLPTLPGPAPAEVHVNKNFMTSAVKPFNQAGYKTHYVYGGGLGWRNMSPFLLGLGFDELHGETRIKASLGKDIKTHPWGVFDEDLFRYIQSVLENATEPQMMFVLTTTNHPPFQVPESFSKPNFQFPSELSNRMTKNSKTIQDRLSAYRYSMDSLSGFMDWVKEQNHSYVVAASGDHSFYESVQFYPENLLEWRGVPLYLYSSEVKLEKDKLESLYSSHASIFPTLYDLSLNDISYIATSPSLLRDLDHFSASNLGFVSELGYTSGDKYFKWGSGFRSIPFKDNFTENMRKRMKQRRAYFAVAMDLINKSPNKTKEK